METFENQKKTILLVDDHKETKEMYGELLKKNNFNVVSANDGIEGLDIATSKKDVDLIFTGIIMPRMDGFQLMKSLKEYTSTSDIPVVINSHMGREEDREKATELGAKDFIVRGTTPPYEVVNRLNRVLDLGDYLLYLKQDEGDFDRFRKDLGLSDEFNCKNCNSKLTIKMRGLEPGIFESRIFCENCDKNVII